MIFRQTRFFLCWTHSKLICGYALLRWKRNYLCQLEFPGHFWLIRLTFLDVINKMANNHLQFPERWPRAFHLIFVLSCLFWHIKSWFLVLRYSSVGPLSIRVKLFQKKCVANMQRLLIKTDFFFEDFCLLSNWVKLGNGWKEGRKDCFACDKTRRLLNKSKWNQIQNKPADWKLLTSSRRPKSTLFPWQNNVFWCLKSNVRPLFWCAKSF